MSLQSRIAVLTAILVLIVGQRTAGAAEPREDQEPPLLLYLEADGKKIPVELDKPIKLDDLSGAKSATLRAEPHRVFAYGGVSFHYPREFSFARNLNDENATGWVVSAGGYAIMVQRIKGQDDPAKILDLVVKHLVTTQFKDARPIQSDTKLELKDATLKGRGIELSLANQSLKQELYAFAVGDDTVTMILQDAPLNGKPAPTRAKAEKMLKETLKIPKK